MSETKTYDEATLRMLCSDTQGNPVAPFQVVRLFEGDVLDETGVAFLGDDGMDQVKRRIAIDSLALKKAGKGFKVVATTAPAPEVA